METINTRLYASERRHDLDWLRLIAILILLFFHTGMWFNTWDWHLKNSDTTHNIEYWMIWLHNWRMPLLLFISGAGTYMALGKRTPKQFANERVVRLLIPLIFGMFVVVPPQIYYEHMKNYNGYWDFYKTVFNFVPYPKGSFSWHHLWFIAYLFVYSLMSIPFLSYLRSERSTKFRAFAFKVLGSPAGMLLIPSALILISQIALRPYFPDEKHNFTDLSYFIFYFLFFFFGMVCYSNQNIWTAIGNSRRYLLVAAIIVLIPFYACFLQFHELLELPWDKDTISHIFDISAIFVSWFTVITIIAYGQHYLNRSHPWLNKLNKGVYPFYILHQTVIIVIGYYICKLDWVIAAKFWSISFLTLFSCVGFYLILILPFNFMRLFFGVKQERKKP